MTSEKRILILTDPFGPPAYVPRVRMLSMLLAEKGHHVTIMTEKLPNEDFQMANVRLCQMPYFSGNRITDGWRWLTDKLWYERERQFKRYVRQQIKGEHYDVLLCSSFNLFPLPTAATIAKEMQIPLIVDLRDILEQWGGSDYFGHRVKANFVYSLFRKLYEKRNIRRRNAVLKQAQVVTTISTWHTQFLRAINANTHLIYNGYDARQYTPCPQETKQFIISYTGRIYDFKLRDPKTALAALQALIAEAKIDTQDLQLIWHIEPQMIEQMRTLLHEYGLLQYSTVLGFIPQKEAIQILQQSAISLLLTNHPGAQSAKGIMTTKFFEAMGTETPILCTPSDNGCLKDVIIQTNSGIASNDVEEIKAFIMDKYSEWKQNGYTHQSVVGKEVFSRQYQANQIEQLMTDICSKKV